MTTKITKSSGNIFADLGLGDEALELRVRSELMIEIRKRIEERQLTQAEAGALFGVAQPRVSDLLRGQISKFSVDSLLKIVSALGADVRLDVSEAHHIETFEFEVDQEWTAERVHSFRFTVDPLEPRISVATSVNDEWQTAA